MSGTSAQDVEALNQLERACEPATFGRNDEDVLDETYRKAGKMDSDNFLLGLDVERSRLFLRPLTAIDDGCLRARSYGVDGDEHGEWKGERG